MNVTYMHKKGMYHYVGLMRPVHAHLHLIVCGTTSRSSSKIQSKLGSLSPGETLIGVRFREKLLPTLPA